jgi:RNA polymerase sigma-70 factor (ECF subfamily)
MPRTFPKLSDHSVISPTETALACNLVSEMDLLRLKSVARLYARGLPPAVAWDDLLQESLTRVLAGARKRPVDVPMVAFVAGIMKSLRANYLRRARAGADSSEAMRLDDARDELRGLELRDPAPDPERALIAADELDAIKRLFTDDPVALQIIAGLAEGLEAEQIRVRERISRTDYDSARKRMRRCLLREGLTCDKK